MDLELVIGIAGLVLAVLTYFAGVQRGKIQEQERREHDRAAEEDRRLYELRSKLVDEFVDMRRRNLDSGPPALVRLGLDKLGSDEQIRIAIQEMEARTKGSPWGRYAPQVADVNLLAFFRHCSQNGLDFRRTGTIEDVVAAVEEKHQLGEGHGV